MCGIVGAIGQRNVRGILVEGLKRLEYRGYDSAGFALINRKSLALSCIKTVGKVQALEERIKDDSADGHIGIAHTRWATHGKPTQENAHPHLSNDRIALIHDRACRCRSVSDCNCRSCVTLSRTRASTAPSNAHAMSDCVSQT